MHGRAGEGGGSREGGRLSLKLGTLMMAACYVVLFLAGCCGVASGEAHPHQGKVKVGELLLLYSSMGFGVLADGFATSY